MKKVILIALLLVGVLSTYTAQDEPDYSLAQTGLRLEGIYIFIDAKPYHAYDYAGSLKLKADYTDKKALEKILKKTKKKYPAANGLIIDSEDPKKADIITFRGAIKTGGGYRVGDKVRAYKMGGDFVEGKIIQIDNKSDKVRVEYTKDGETTSSWYAFKKVSKATDN